MIRSKVENRIVDVTPQHPPISKAARPSAAVDNSGMADALVNGSSDEHNVARDVKTAAPTQPRQSSRLAAKSEASYNYNSKNMLDPDDSADGIVGLAGKRKRAGNVNAGREASIERRAKARVGREENEGRLSDDATDTVSKEHDKYCHFCQHAKKHMLACESTGCTHRFCLYCLNVHLGDDTDPSTSSAWEAGAWGCPTCRQGCCCSRVECNRAHRHCKAFRYRCRRADAANRRQTAAHALVWLAAASDADTARSPSTHNKAKIQPSGHTRSTQESGRQKERSQRAAITQRVVVNESVEGNGHDNAEGGLQRVFGESSGDTVSESMVVLNEESESEEAVGGSEATITEASEGAALHVLASLFCSAAASCEKSERAQEEEAACTAAPEQWEGSGEAVVCVTEKVNSGCVIEEVRRGTTTLWEGEYVKTESVLG